MSLRFVGVGLRVPDALPPRKATTLLLELADILGSTHARVARASRVARLFDLVMMNVHMYCRWFH